MLAAQLRREEGLDYLKVYLQFYRGMVKAYEPSSKDLENEVIGEARQVVRLVSNPFWLIRDMSRYWEDCAVIAPDNLREKIKQKLAALCKHYEI